MFESYENIGANNPFFTERFDHYARAIEYFELSYKVYIEMRIS